MTNPTKQKKGVSVQHSSKIAVLHQKAGVSRKHFVQCLNSIALLQTDWAKSTL